MTTMFVNTSSFSNSSISFPAKPKSLQPVFTLARGGRAVYTLGPRSRTPGMARHGRRACSSQSPRRRIRARCSAACARRWARGRPLGATTLGVVSAPVRGWGRCRRCYSSRRGGAPWCCEKTRVRCGGLRTTRTSSCPEVGHAGAVVPFGIGLGCWLCWLCRGGWGCGEYGVSFWWFGLTFWGFF